jgi:transcriptional regulator with XRE-family HTH domain
VVLSIHHPRYVALRDHLKALRRGAGLTQIEIADRLKLDQSYVSKIERGERYVDVIFYLDWCTACGVKVAKAVAQLEKSGGGQNGKAVPTLSRLSDKA